MRCYQCDDFFEDDEIYCQCCFNGRGFRLSEAEGRIKVLEGKVKVMRDFLTDLMADGANAILATLDQPQKTPRPLVPVNEEFLEARRRREAEISENWGISVPHKIPNPESLDP